jgi:hypothetical protein
MEVLMAKDTKERILAAALEQFSQNGYAGTNIRELTASLGLVKSAMYEQSDWCAAFHSSVDIINSPAYIHGNPDMFSGDICGCSGRTFHKDRKGD